MSTGFFVFTSLFVHMMYYMRRRYTNLLSSHEWCEISAHNVKA